jgi:hypothetical protein
MADMATDYTALAVAVVGVVGSVSSPILTQLVSLRTKKTEALLLRQDKAAETEAEEKRTAYAEKLKLYADLNATARQFRTAALDLVHGVRLSRDVTALREELDEARHRYRDLYARAQMVLPETPMDVASEVNRCLSTGYRTIVEIETSADPAGLATRALDYFEGPLANAVGLLRTALRADLGVVTTEKDLADRRVRLRTGRKVWEASLARRSQAS